MSALIPSPAAPAPRILLVDDQPSNLTVLAAALEPAGYEILAASGGVTALKVAEKGRPDLILLDVLMPDLDGLETCRRLKASAATADIPVMFLTARTEMAGVVEGFQAGGVDYITKPFEAEIILSRVATHLRLSRLSRELRERNQMLEQRTRDLVEEMERRRQAETALQQADDTLAVLSGLEAERWNLEGIVGGSRLIRKIIGDIRRLQQFSQTSVLILGESGTGKELVARAIHFDSARAKGPFVPVNCVAIPGELAESMLFGHVKGAFTGATADRKGYFELAHGGTLFLDEIGDMPASLQVKLLRVLEDGCVTAVGASKPRRVDVRILSATNANLQARITAGTFRQDLYFRLARYTVSTPPLRERPEDVPVLATHFVRLFAAEMGFKAPAIRPEAMERLQAHDYPGNVRELKNIIERALIESGGGTIRIEHLGLASTQPAPAVKPPQAQAQATAFAESLPLNLAEAEGLLIQKALQATGGNIADAARMLGIHRTRIYRKLAE